MRTIKFRAWDKNIKKMFYTYDVGLSDGNMDLLDFQFNIENQNSSLTLMQYTGLTDKNGKAIYEGDVIQRDDGARGSVYYQTESEFAQWSVENYINSDRSDWYTWNSIKFDFGRDCEVIGNVFENPELLDEQKEEK